MTSAPNPFASPKSDFEPPETPADETPSANVADSLPWAVLSLTISFFSVSARLAASVCVTAILLTYTREDFPSEWVFPAVALLRVVEMLAVIGLFAGMGLGASKLSGLRGRGLLVVAAGAQALAFILDRSHSTVIGFGFFEIASLLYPLSIAASFAALAFYSIAPRQTTTRYAGRGKAKSAEVFGLLSVTGTAAAIIGVTGKGQALQDIAWQVVTWLQPVVLTVAAFALWRARRVAYQRLLADRLAEAKTAAMVNSATPVGSGIAVGS